MKSLLKSLHNSTSGSKKKVVTLNLLHTSSRSLLILCFILVDEHLEKLSVSTAESENLSSAASEDAKKKHVQIIRVCFGQALVCYNY